jgi:hypothetical protein
MTAYHASRLRLANRNRLEVSVFCNSEECGYEIVDRISGRVIERSTGHDGQWKAASAGRTALEMREHPEWFVTTGCRRSGSFCTDRGDW